MTTTTSTYPITFTYYDVLDLKTPDFTGKAIKNEPSPQIIKQAYRDSLLKHHPDKLNIINGLSKETSQISKLRSIDMIQQAYKVLSSIKLKEEYHEYLQKKQRVEFNIQSTDGIELFSLDNFNYEEIEIQESNEVDIRWTKDCPRCKTHESFILTEDDLADSGTICETEGNKYELVIQCSACSLWIKVFYYDTGDEE